MPIEEFAPAKINLALHLTGRRADGYHLLDSLVVFADIGDRLSVDRGDRFALAVDGPFSVGVPQTGNLIERAMTTGQGVAPVRVSLTKNLPVAAGIGGGSADAAAAARAAVRLGFPQPEPDALLALGADVPMCMQRTPARVGGIGERVERLDRFPGVDLVLVNPGTAVSTAAVFAARQGPFGDGLGRLPVFAGAVDLAQWLKTRTRNELEPAAKSVAPDIARVLESLGSLPGALLSRMSGSGATCFALFPDRATARAAADVLTAQHPGWWVAACRSYASGDA